MSNANLSRTLNAIACSLFQGVPASKFAIIEHGASSQKDCNTKVFLVQNERLLNGKTSDRIKIEQPVNPVLTHRLLT